MTLDEAIQHAEEVAEDKETRAKECIVKANSNNEWLFDYEVRKLNEESVSCAECAAEHRQLAEWLKDYNRLLGQEPCEDCISREAAICLADELKDDLPDDDRLSDMVMSHNEGILEYQTKLSLLPSAALAKKVGNWIAQDIHNCHTDFRCSACGYIHSFMHLYGKPEADYTYCPNCGAKMERTE